MHYLHVYKQIYKTQALCKEQWSFTSETWHANFGHSFKLCQVNYFMQKNLKKKIDLKLCESYSLFKDHGNS